MYIAVVEYCFLKLNVATNRSSLIMNRFMRHVRRFIG